MEIDKKLNELLKSDISEQELQGSVAILSDVFNKGIETGMIGTEEHDAFFTKLDGVLGEIYKAKKDLSKLRKVRKQVTRGGKTFMQTVYVKAGEEEQKSGKDFQIKYKKEFEKLGFREMVDEDFYGYGGAARGSMIKETDKIEAVYEKEAGGLQIFIDEDNFVMLNKDEVETLVENNLMEMFMGDAETGFASFKTVHVGDSGYSDVKSYMMDTYGISAGGNLTPGKFGEKEEPKKKKEKKSREVRVEEIEGVIYSHFRDLMTRLRRYDDEFEIKSYGENQFEFFLPTGQRGPRTDHGGGPDGDGWLTWREVENLRLAYAKNWDPKVNAAVKDLEKLGYKVDGRVMYGEKGHVDLFFELKY